MAGTATQARPKTNGAAGLTLVGNKDQLRQVLGEAGFQESLRAVATKYMTVDRVAKVSLLAASRQPKLLQCTAMSFLQSVIKAAELGLEFGGSTGQAYLIPFKNGWLSKKAGRDVYECQFLPGYRGFIELAYRSGHVSFIDCQLVYQKDQFDYGYDYGAGQSPFIKHKPFMGTDRGPVVCAYSVIMLKDSPVPKIDFMSAEELDQIRECSKSKNDGPWVTFPGEMQKKSVIRRSIKWIRTTPELNKAEEADNVDYDLSGQSVVDADHQLGAEGCKRRLMDRENPQEASKEAATEIEEHFGGEPEENAEGPDLQEGIEQAESCWMCNEGHAFDTPKPKKGTDGVCPECGSENIEKMG